MAAVTQFCRRLLICIPFALGLSWVVPPANLPQMQNVQDDIEADTAWQQAYGGMSEQDLAAGWVLEPVDGE